MRPMFAELRGRCPVVLLYCVRQLQDAVFLREFAEVSCDPSCIHMASGDMHHHTILCVAAAGLFLVMQVCQGGLWQGLHTKADKRRVDCVVGYRLMDGYGTWLSATCKSTVHHSLKYTNHGLTL